MDLAALPRNTVHDVLPAVRKRAYLAQLPVEPQRAIGSWQSGRG